MCLFYFSCLSLHYLFMQHQTAKSRSDGKFIGRNCRIIICCKLCLAAHDVFDKVSGELLYTRTASGVIIIFRFVLWCGGFCVLET